MADNPIRDNTTALEKQTEAELQTLQAQQQATDAQRDLARGVHDLASLQAKFASETRRIENQPAQTATPQPPQSAAPLPPRPAQYVPPQLVRLMNAGGQHSYVPGQGFVAVNEHTLPEHVAAWHDAMRQTAPNRVPPSGPPNNPPSNPPNNLPSGGNPPSNPASGPPNNPPPSPLSPPQSPLARAIAELDRRMATLRSAYEGGVKPDHLAARNLRRSVTEQEGYMSERFAGLKPDEQRQAMPQMMAMERQRKELMEQENRLRKQNNEEMTRGQYALAGFVRNLAAGNPMGAAGAAVGGLGGMAGVLGGIALAVVQNVLQRESRYQNEVKQGGVSLSPSMSDTEKKSEELARLREARRTGERERQEAKARTEQLRAHARTMPGWARTHDPEDWMNFWEGSGHAARVEQHAKNQYALDRLRMPQPRAEARYQQRIAEELERWIKENGGKTPEFKRNISMPGGVEGGITSAMAYQSELQVGALQSKNVDNEILQEQLRELQEQGGLLRRIEQALSGLENLRPRWS